MVTATQDRQRLLPRDFESLAVVGRFRMLKRSQLHRWKFHGLSDTVVRRFIARMVERGWLGTERLNKNGIQVIWCTPAGRDVLIARGIVPPEELFPGRGPVPVKDMAHTAAIVDAAIWLVELARAGDKMLPAWTLQRLLGGRAEVVPDLLCLTASTDAHTGAVLAVEVDLANEAVASCLVPKTAKLVSFLRRTAVRRPGYSCSRWVSSGGTPSSRRFGLCLWTCRSSLRNSVASPPRVCGPRVRSRAQFARSNRCAEKHIRLRARGRIRARKRISQEGGTAAPDARSQFLTPDYYVELFL